jgi:hypothetical protein
VTNEELGQAYKAFEAYNHKAKDGSRLKDFDAWRWVHVCKAIELQGPIKRRATHKKAGWTPERTAKFKATMAAKRKAKTVNGQPNTRAGWAKLLQHEPNT